MVITECRGDESTVCHALDMASSAAGLQRCVSVYLGSDLNIRHKCLRFIKLAVEEEALKVLTKELI